METLESSLMLPLSPTVLEIILAALLFLEPTWNKTEIPDLLPALTLREDISLLTWWLQVSLTLKELPKWLLLSLNPLVGTFLTTTTLNPILSVLDKAVTSLTKDALMLTTISMSSALVKKKEDASLLDVVVDSVELILFLMDASISAPLSTSIVKILMPQPKLDFQIFKFSDIMLVVNALMELFLIDMVTSKWVSASDLPAMVPVLEQPLLFKLVTATLYADLKEQLLLLVMKEALTAPTLNISAQLLADLTARETVWDVETAKTDNVFAIEALLVMTAVKGPKMKINFN